MRHSAAIPFIGWERFWRSELEKKETHILILFSFLCTHFFLHECVCSQSTFLLWNVWREGNLGTSVCLWQHSLQGSVRDHRSVLWTPPREKKQSASVCLLYRKVFSASVEDWSSFQFCLPYLQQQSIISQFIITFFSVSLATHCEHYGKTGLLRLTIFIRPRNHQPLCVSASTLHFEVMGKIKVKNFHEQLILILYVLF